MISLDFPLFTLQIANPGLWSFCSSLYTSILDLQAFSLGSRSATRPQPPVFSLCSRVTAFPLAESSVFPLPTRWSAASSRLEVLSKSGDLSLCYSALVRSQLSIFDHFPQIFALLGFHLNPRFLSSISNRGPSSIEFLF